MSVLVLGFPTTLGGVKNYVTAYIKTLESLLNEKPIFARAKFYNRNSREATLYIVIGWRNALKYLPSLIELCPHSHFQILELGEILAFPESLPPFTVFDVLEYKFSIKALEFYRRFSKVSELKGIDYSVIVVSDFVKSILSPIIPNGKVNVLPPPINYSRKAIYDSPCAKKKENVIIEVGRFTPRKRFEEIIFTSRKIKTDNRVFILGYRKSFYNHLYSLYCSFLRKALNIGNVHFIPNAPFKIKKDTLARAKVFLHPRPLGAFELAVAEAMGFGLVPVVRYGSVAWAEVLDKGKYGFAYRDADECAEIIEQLLDGKIYEEWSARAVLRAKEFSYENFRRKLAKIIETIMRITRLRDAEGNS